MDEIKQQNNIGLPIIKTSIPCRCPICEGNGLVPYGFYSKVSVYVTSTSVTEQCRFCSGSGVVLAYQEIIK